VVKAKAINPKAIHGARRTRIAVVVAVVVIVSNNEQ
jgi:hypothetical protein